MKQETKKKNSKIIIMVLVLSAFIATFNETILNVALPKVMNDFNVNAGTGQWVITAYMIVTSIMVPVTAFLYETFKTKKLFMGALTLLLVGTVLCAISFTFPMLMVSRMIQAAGTGMLIPIMMNTVLLVSPKEQLGASMAACVCGISLGPAFGPTFAGIILSFANWHMLFVILLVPIVIVMILGYIFVENVAKITKPKLDILSVILSMAGLALVIYGISSIMTSVSTGVITSVAGILIIAIFGKRQMKLKEPMLNLLPFKYKKYDMGVLLVMIAMMISFSMNVIMPLYLQGACKKSSFISAMMMLPAVVISAIATAVSGKILDKYGEKVMLPCGFMIMVLTVFSLTTFTSGTGTVIIMAVYLCIFIGIAFTMSPSQTSALKELPKEYYPHGVAIMNTFTQISACIGTSLYLGVYSVAQEKALAAGSVYEDAVASGFTAAAMTATVIVLIGFLVSLIFVKTKKTN